MEVGLRSPRRQSTACLALALKSSWLIYVVPEIQGTTQEVAIAKVKAAADKLGRACVTEDTALCFEALDGLPGPYIKDFLGKLGHEGEYTTPDTACS